MTYEIEHLTRYEYTSDVFLEPHTVRLSPRLDGAVQLLDQEQAVMPAPDATTRALDYNGNIVDRYWFSGKTNSLTIRQSLKIRTLRANAFDYIPDTIGEQLPPVYPAAAARVLTPFLETATSDRVKQFLVTIVGPRRYGNIQSALDSGTVSDHGLRCSEYITALNQSIASRFRTIVRKEGEAWSADTTLGQTEASCRDLAVLFCASCRAFGIASRFVSGYQAGDPQQETRDLHAWAEVYTTDGGWRGFDPTLGLAVADEHVPLATAAAPNEASPVAGSFRGTGVRSRLHHEIHLSTLP
ncbi:MAG: transglutaminase family protein [Spirochaetota bacterium]